MKKSVLCPRLLNFVFYMFVISATMPLNCTREEGWEPILHFFCLSQTLKFQKNSRRTYTWKWVCLLGWSWTTLKHTCQELSWKEIAKCTSEHACFAECTFEPNALLSFTERVWEGKREWDGETKFGEAQKNEGLWSMRERTMKMREI